tara:strand:+ start:356 stop:583 length:228 start_codon:yes stop_codon:yes gene_type:complete
MRREDVVELIRCEMPDLTDGPFDVRIESDDGGTHICIHVEFHEDAQYILRRFFNFHGHKRIMVKKVPEDSLNPKT